MNKFLLPIDSGVRGPRDYIRIQREYIQAIKPYTDMMHAIYSVVMPKIMVHTDGRVEYHHDFTDEQKETLRLIDEGIAQVQRRMGLTPQAPPAPAQGGLWGDDDD